jgi:copper homeostasis protein
MSDPDAAARAPRSTARPQLEIAVTSVSGARTALDNGADRVELCSALELGGLTPSQGLVASVLAVGIPVHALVRSRPGDFVYNIDELDTMIAEVRALVAQGVAGVVIGALTADGTLDIPALQHLVAATRHSPSGNTVEVTLHRAVDQSVDPLQAVRELAALGITRVLSSGGAPSAAAGSATIAAMVHTTNSQGDSAVEIMAGGGVTVADIPALTALGVHAIHLSAKTPAVARRAAGWVPLGSAGSDADSDVHFLTDGAVVAAARASLDVLTALDAPAPNAI